MVDEIVEVFLLFCLGVDCDVLIVEMNVFVVIVLQVFVVLLGDLLDMLIGMGLMLGVVINDVEVLVWVYLDVYGVMDWFVFIVGYDSGYGGKFEVG